MQNSKDIQYLSTDVLSDFIDNFKKLEMFINSYLLGKKDDFKWVILSLQMTLQSVFVLVLKFTYPIIIQKNETTHQVGKTKYKFIIDWNSEPDNNFVKQKNKNEIILGFDSITKNNIAKTLDELKTINSSFSKKILISIFNKMNTLHSFTELYQRTKKDEYMKQLYYSKTLPKEKYAYETIKYIVYCRNNFVHFTPKHWGIILDTEYNMITNSLKLLKFYLFESNNVYDDDNKIENANIKIRINNLLNKIEETKQKNMLNINKTQQ